MAVVGESGSGKTTLLNLISTLDGYDSGEIIIGNREIKSLDCYEKEYLLRNVISIVFQEYHLLKEYDVIGNVLLGASIQNKKVYETDVNNILKKVGLLDKRDNKITELSGGQRQRVALARALIRDSNIILADEPTGNLDDKTEKLIIENLKEISKEKLVIMVIHNKSIAYQYADMVVEFSEGIIIKIDHINSYTPEFEKDVMKIPDTFTFEQMSWDVIFETLVREKQIKLQITNDLNENKKLFLGYIVQHLMFLISKAVLVFIGVEFILYIFASQFINTIKILENTFIINIEYFLYIWS